MGNVGAWSMMGLLHIVLKNARELSRILLIIHSHCVLTEVQVHLLFSYVYLEYSAHNWQEEILLKILQGELTCSHKVPSIGRQGKDVNMETRKSAAVQQGVFHYPAGHSAPQTHSLFVFSTIIKIICFWLLIHKICACLSSILWALCLFGLPLMSVTVSDLLCSHTGGERRVWSPSGKRGERRPRRPCMYFPAVTFTMPWCYRVINQGLLPQGQPGAEGGDGMKGQKVSRVNVMCHMWWFPLFVLPETQ